MFLQNGRCLCCFNHDVDGDDDVDSDDCTGPKFLSDSTATNTTEFFCNFLRRKSVHLCVWVRAKVCACQSVCVCACASLYT